LSCFPARSAGYHLNGADTASRLTPRARAESPAGFPAPPGVPLISLPLYFKARANMLRIKITESGHKRLEELQFDIEEALNGIIEFIPKLDLIGLSHISVTDIPAEWKDHLKNASGAYFQKTKNNPAYIEIYLSKICKRSRVATT